MICLRQAGPERAAEIHSMQVRAFMPLYNRYGDTETTPALEPVARVRERIEDSATRYFVIERDGTALGAIRVQCKGNVCRISPLFVLPEYQGQGIAQQAMRLAEAEYPDAVRWHLVTILQEKANCHLYEKMGYMRTGSETVINEKMTLVGYEKLRKN